MTEKQCCNAFTVIFSSKPKMILRGPFNHIPEHSITHRKYFKEISDQNCINLTSKPKEITSYI